MIRKSRWSVLVIVLLLIGSLLSACSGSKDTSSKTSTDNGQSSQSNQKPVTISLGIWSSSPAEKNQLNEVLKSFKSSHPNITVKLDVITDQYMDVIKTRLVGGKAPDVFYLDASEAPGLISKGVLEPLDSYVKNTKGFDVSDFNQPLVDAFKGQDGKTYGFPKDFSTLGLFYNKDMFKKAGITTPPKTWDEMVQDAKKLTQGKKVYGLGIQPELARVYNIAESLGGKIVTDNKASFATDKVAKALQPIINLHLKDKVLAQPQEVGAKWTGEMFGQQRAAMVIEGPWTIPFMKDTFPKVNYGVAELPTINGKKSTMAYTVAYVMNKQSQHKDAAWQLISYLTGKKGMKEWTKGGIALPTRKSVAQELGYDKDPLRAAFVKGASYSTVWQAGVNLPTIMQNFNNEFLAAYLGKKPLDKALKTAQTTANKEIANSK